MSSKNNFYFKLQALHKEVTGSCILCTIHFPNNHERNILVDCGIYQEQTYEDLNNEFKFNIKNIDAVILTHSHIDHIGRVPYLSKLGYNGPVYCNALTRNLFGVLLYDCAKKFQKDFEKEKRTVKNPTPPLYNYDDVDKAISLIKTKRINEPFEIDDGITITFIDNGHMLSASSIYIEASYKNRKKINLLFSGDYKKENLFKETSVIPQSIAENKNLNLVIESTLFESYQNSPATFKDDIISQLKQEKPILILSLAQERLETILYNLKEIESCGHDFEIWIDAPLGISILDIYRKNSNINFMPKNVNVVVSQEEREILLKNPKKGRIIITSSGMADGGNAPYYLETYLRCNSAIFFTSYLSNNSLGRKVVETSRGNKIRVFPFGEQIKINAQIFQTREFSSHGSPEEILDFIKSFSSLKNVFINHGSEKSQKILKNTLGNMDIKSTILGNEEIHKVTNLGDVYSTLIHPPKKEIKNTYNRPSKYSNLENRTIPASRRKKSCINY